MNKLIRLEELFILGLSVYLFSLLDYAWWWYPLLLLAPDVSMAGYLAGPAFGAVLYNLFHHRALAVAAYVAGSRLGIHLLPLAGVILLGHISMDRMLGYGLKHADHFRHTHLGWIGAPPGPNLP